MEGISNHIQCINSHLEFISIRPELYSFNTPATEVLEGDIGVIVKLIIITWLAYPN